jgi:predicted nuclease of predicted toxin-antitoxin system
MRFLIDECISLELVRVAGEAGYEAQHVVRIGKASWQDWNIAAHAYDGSFVLVTNNGSDFKRLYAVQSIHPGLVIILPNVGLPSQIRLFRRALDELSVVGEPINRVLEVDFEGDDITVNLYDLAADQP